MDEEKVKKIPQGNGKRIIRIVGGIIIMFVAVCAITWIVSLFLPNNVERAIEILKDLFKQILTKTKIETIIKSKGEQDYGTITGTNQGIFNGKSRTS